MRRFAVGVVGSGLVAVGAWGLNLAIRRAAELPEVEEERAVAAGVTSGAPAPSVDFYVDGILARNLFDAASIGRGNPPPVRREDLRVTLLGTSVAESEVYSAALILDEDSRDLPRAYSVGGRVKGMTVVSIEALRVGLAKEDGEIAYLLLDRDEVAAPDEEPVAGTLERRVLEQALADPAGLAQLGRIGPHRGPDGAVDGYRLSGLRKGTLPDELGLRNGDVVHSLNGQPLTPALLGTLATATRLCVAITRRGAPTELCYDLR